MISKSIVLTPLALTTVTKCSLSTTEYRVLWHLAVTLPVTGDIVSKSELAETLEVSQVYVNAVMGKLCQLGFLTRGPKSGRSYHYKLNPAFLRQI